MMRRFGTYVFFIIGAALLILYIVEMSKPTVSTDSDSTDKLLNYSWINYKKNYLFADGRIIDPLRGDATTSEGQSYAMLRSVWLNDKETFDLVWNWTKNNLKRNDDHLLAWKWGKKQDGTYGFNSPGDNNSASDGDTDIAFALILANRRWNDPTYLEDLNLLLPDIWNLETAQANGKRYLIGGNWANTENSLIINPSYFSPYAWRIFVSYDKEHDWASLIDPSYELLQETVTDNLNNKSSSGLPPDWLELDKNTGKIRATDKPEMSTNYSSDALRIPWRIALDYKWNNDKQAKYYLSSAFKFLTDEYASSGKLAGSYAHSGEKINEEESAALYATSLVYFQIFDETIAKEIYENKILKLYTDSNESFKDSLSYYDQNWLWFGVALYDNKISNFVDTK